MNYSKTELIIIAVCVIGIIATILHAWLDRPDYGPFPSNVSATLRDDLIRSSEP